MYTKEQMKEAMKFAASKAKGKSNFDTGIYDDEIDSFLKGIGEAFVKPNQLEENEIEFYNTDFPNKYNDFIYLSRSIDERELELCDKEGLIILCQGLKIQELKYYQLYHQLLNKTEGIL